MTECEVCAWLHATDVCSVFWAGEGLGAVVGRRAVEPKRLAITDHDLRSLASLTQSQARPPSVSLHSAHRPRDHHGLATICADAGLQRQLPKEASLSNHGAYDPVACTYRRIILLRIAVL